MSRLVTVTVRSMCLFFGFAGLAAAQDPPALEPPSLEPPRAGTAQPSQPDASTEAREHPEGRRLARSERPGPARGRAARDRGRCWRSRGSPRRRHGLRAWSVRRPRVRPGADLALPTPARRPAASLGIRAVPVALGGGPSLLLDGPPSPPSLDALPSRPDASAPPRRSNDAVRVRPRTSTGRPTGETIPLTIEPIDGDPPNLRGPTGRPATARSNNGRAPDGPATARPDDEPADPRPAPRRGTGILGRLFGPPPPPPPTSREASRSDAKTKSDPDTDKDLDADVIARRRIERQIRATLGDKVRSFEVRITGRNVVIVAQPSRFWLRRSVRHSLETLPALQGYRARIEISD